MNVELGSRSAGGPIAGSLGQMLADDASAAQAPAAVPATAPAAPATPADDNGPITPDEASGGKTPEEIEAYWRNRVSRKDAAHAAAERTLREQIASLSAPKPPTTGTDGQPGNGGGNDAAVADLQRQLDEERALRLVDQRKAKYPALAAQGVSDDVFKASDEASLAKMNALADDASDGAFIAPTTPRRTASVAPKPLNQKTKAELESDLRAASTVYEAHLRGR